MHGYAAYNRSMASINMYNCDFHLSRRARRERIDGRHDRKTAVLSQYCPTRLRVWSSSLLSVTGHLVVVVSLRTPMDTATS